MATPICDFCSSPHVAWAYPCRDFVQEDRISALVVNADGSVETRKVALTHSMAGGWAACQPCYRLIQVGDRDSLAKRSVASAGSHQLPPLVELELMRRLQDTFWSNRLGAPVPTTPNITKDPTR
jgi:hypothetical protein